jgi:hypothetical protein
MRYRLDHLLAEPLAKLYHPLLVARWAGVTAFTRKCGQKYVTFAGKVIYVCRQLQLTSNARRPASQDRPANGHPYATSIYNVSNASKDIQGEVKGGLGDTKKIEACGIKLANIELQTINVHCKQKALYDVNIILNIILGLEVNIILLTRAVVVQLWLPPAHLVSVNAKSDPIPLEIQVDNFTLRGGKLHGTIDAVDIIALFLKSIG